MSKKNLKIRTKRMPTKVKIAMELSRLQRKMMRMVKITKTMMTTKTKTTTNPVEILNSKNPASKAVVPVLWHY